jgi:hypothetical protein
MLSVLVLGAAATVAAHLTVTRPAAGDEAARRGASRALALAVGVQGPYDRMWGDDRHWMPLLLAGRRFEARALWTATRS